MKIIIDTSTSEIINRLESTTRFLIKFLYRWITNEGEALGYILGSLHFMISIFLFILIIVAHTVYPNFYFQIGIFICLFIIWIQHVVLKVCISIVAEKKLTNNISPFHKLLEDLFHISPTEFGNYLVIAETVAIGCFGLEIISRSLIYLHRYISNNSNLFF